MFSAMSAMKLAAAFLALGMGIPLEPVRHASMVSMWMHRAKRSDSAVTPLEKVISLLEDLKADVESEAKDEAEAYDKFACFCKDNTKDKGEAIKEGQTTIDDQTAIIEEKTAKMEKKTTELAEYRKKAEELKLEMQELETARKKEKAEFEVIVADLRKALKSMEKAIEVLESSKPSLLTVKATIRKSMVFADALGISSKHIRTMNAFLQSDDPPGEYEFKSQEIIDTLKDMKKEFSEKEEKKVKEEEDAAKAHEELMGEKGDMLKTQEEGITECETIIDECKQAISDAQLELTEAEAELKDNQLYLKDLTERCEGKAKQWDQRTKSRADEIEALTAAMETIKDIKEAKRALLQADGKKESSLITKKSAVYQGAFVAEDDAGAGAGEDDVGSSLSFMQRGRSKAARQIAHSLLKGYPVKSTDSDAQNNRRSKVAALLTSEGSRLKSTLLISAASKVVAELGPDPFKKIKQLIQELIERMLQEMKDEATQKGICDENLGKAYNDRDSRLAKIKKLNAELMNLKVRKETAEETIDTLTSELEDLEDSLKKATKQRDEEKEENAETITSSEEGAKAVAEAIQILQDFYKKAAKNLLQASPIDEEGENPGAGFEGNYKGKQDAAGGIIGMLEVIKSDFERSVRQTSAAEAESHREFVNFDRASKVSIAEKETGKEHAKSDLKSTDIALEEATTDFKDTQKMLDETLKELETLTSECIDTGMSYAERVAAREEEIAALKKALCMLDPEGVEPDC